MSRLSADPLVSWIGSWIGGGPIPVGGAAPERTQQPCRASFEKIWRLRIGARMRGTAL